MRDHGRCRNSGCGNAKMGVAPNFSCALRARVPHPFLTRLATMLWCGIATRVLKFYSLSMKLKA